MIALRIAVVAFAALLFAACAPVVEGSPAETVAAHVTDILETGDHAPPGAALPQPFERVRVQLDESLYRGDVVEVEWNGKRALDANGLLRPGDHVLLTVTRQGNDRSYAVAEVVRLPTLIPVAALLVVALLVVARLKGLATLAGLAASIGVFLLAIVPATQRGDDPLLAAIVGSIAAIAVLVFVVHGLGRRSVVAFCGTLAGLGVVTAVGAFALATARITGLGSEDQVLLATAAAGRIDMPRLALAAVMVGSLGAMVDMSISQASTATLLASADDSLRGRRLYMSALTAGRDHVGSLVNTLAMAYLGGALPLVLLVSLGSQPLPISINGEAIVGTMIAIMAAMLGVVLSVPITTFIAVTFAGRVASPELED